VSDTMMGLEMNVAETVDLALDGLEDTLNEIRTTTLESHTTFFRAIEELEEKFSLRLRSVAMALLDHFAKNELVGGVSISILL
jgi:hypothetical protein